MPIKVKIMQICFSGEIPYAIKVDGALKGYCANEPFLLDNPQDDKLIELLPLNRLGTPYCFLPYRNYFSLPETTVVKTDLKGGYMLRLLACDEVYPRALLKEKTAHFILNAFVDKSLCVTIETPSEYFVDRDINFSPISATSFTFNLNGQNFLGIAFKKESYFLVVYHFGQKIQKVFADSVCDYSVKNGFSVTKSFIDMAKHKVTSFYTFKDGKLIKSTSATEKSAFFNVNALPVKLLPFAFFESLLTGDDLTDYLDNSLLGDADKLKGYFGDFYGVMPPPSFRKKDQVGLIYPCGQNLFEVGYATVEMQNRKIVNLRKIQL